MAFSDRRDPLGHRPLRVPHENLVRMHWAATSPKGRVVTCEEWRTEPGLEMRLMINGEFSYSTLCRGTSASIELRMHAEEWRHRLARKGFSIREESRGDSNP